MSHCSISSSTIDSIDKMFRSIPSTFTCDESENTSCSSPPPIITYSCNERSKQSINRCSVYGCDEFTSMITPVTELYGESSGCRGSVQFRIRRKNKVVNLQWEPFIGIIGASGISHLTVTQTICNLPPYTIRDPIIIQYKGDIHTSFVEIDPHNRCGNIKFYLPSNLSCEHITHGDSFKVYAKCISWIVEI